MTLRLTTAQAAAMGLIKVSPAASARTRRNPIGCGSPQDRLQSLLESHFPGVVELEYPNAVPGRKFRMDAAFPAAKLGVEIDGWEFHGKFKRDFLRDRERDRLLVLNGWRLLRFAASEIRRQPWTVLEQVRAGLAASARL